MNDLESSFYYYCANYHPFIDLTHSYNEGFHNPETRKLFHFYSVGYLEGERG